VWLIGAMVMVCLLAAPRV